MSTKSKKLESFFKDRINRDIKEKEKKERESEEKKEGKDKKRIFRVLGFT